MGATATDAAIPASVTVPGEDLFRILVDLERIDDALIHQEMPDSEALGSCIVDLYKAAFGPMFRECDEGFPEGTRPDGTACLCEACNGGIEESATPIYRLIVERAKDEQRAQEDVDSRVTGQRFGINVHASTPCGECGADGGCEHSLKEAENHV